VEEYGYVALIPEPNIIYGGKASRYDRTTGQVQNIAPDGGRAGRHRFLRTAPLLFHRSIRMFSISAAMCSSGPPAAGKAGR